MARKQRSLHPDEPLRHSDHRRPVSRREFISQGFLSGGAAAFGLSPLASLLFARKANALDLGSAFDSNPDNLRSLCNVGFLGANKVPFICFDLSGGANIAGSNVLVGGEGGQEDVLTTAGYSKLGIKSDNIPSPGGASSFINEEFGLRFHSTSAMLEGMMETARATTRGFINGMVIPARSENDTANNPHNPTFGIYRAGADGGLLSLIGSRNSESGGNSMAPPSLVVPSALPTKIDRASDSLGLVDTGKLTTLLDTAKAVNVMEAMYKITNAKLSTIDSGDGDDTTNQIRCAYAKSADNIETYGDQSQLDIRQDEHILLGADPIFSEELFNQSREYEKTATIMKLVINGFAGAGTITMGGYDYHTGDRVTGEARDKRAGHCIGACLEYAHRVGKPLMIYVFSDGGISSNGREDPNAGGKPEWTGDNQATGAAFILVYNPSGVTSIRNQLGYMTPEGNAATNGSPAANSVTQLVNTVILNYMALHDEIGNFSSIFGGADHGLGSDLNSLVGFEPIVSGTIS
ncbi:general secretion pathway protein GspF [Hahella sp. CCB-MM4]|uniref:general secretion pathway protein GspF n=1 Tax=Hahella sp. (strain CCB-MM4) TaxID=1926491 RepID=UPI000B9C525F|nr:general secretion pathway protein GspF [Hahella sp. CCB-MM4]OZG73538.1 general secretion pathway protein GspF [Hahella sp. CCB-MM4]